MTDARRKASGKLPGVWSAARARRRLALGLALFALALGVPLALLFHHVLDRLTVERHLSLRVSAEELTAQIDARAQELIAEEENRRFEDFGFLTLQGEPAANFLQLSPLSRWPTATRLVGVRGYFQIDPEGAFTSPLLPPDAGAWTAVASYGISAAEFAARRARAREVLGVLQRNDIATTQGPAAATLAEAALEQRQVARSKSKPMPMVAKDRPKEYASDDLRGDDAKLTAAVEDAKVASESSRESLKKIAAKQQAFRKRKVEVNVPSQLADAGANAGAAGAMLDEEGVAAAAPPAPAAQAAANVAAAPPPSARRDETNNAFSSLSSAASSAGAGAAGGLADAPRPAHRPHGARAAAGRGFLRFEGEIDPFQLAELASGELVLFRKVWRDKQRFIQGAVIDRHAFLEALVKDAFGASALAGVAALDVTVGDESALKLAADGVAWKNGVRLASLPLSSPLDDVVLTYSAARLARGPSERYVLLLSVVLVLILAAGAGAILLAGRRQIALAQQQRDFVSAVSHELKTPLTSIRMYSEMLREGWASEEKKRTYYDFIFHESERLSRLIANVLKLAGLARGLPIAVETLTPADAYGRVRPLLASQCANAGFALDEVLPEANATPSVTARFDVDALTQILVNLVDNAIKFSRRAGATRVTVGFAVEPGAAGGVRFFVRDYGPGIEPEALPRIFDLFYRADAEKRAATPGTGIGLALVRDMAATMQATMAVESRPGQTELTLVVPRAT